MYKLITIVVFLLFSANVNALTWEKCGGKYSKFYRAKAFNGWFVHVHHTNSGFVFVPDPTNAWKSCK